MNSINLADAKAHLSELVALAEAGEDVCIMRRGKPVARLTSAGAPKKPVSLAELRAVTEAMVPQAEPAGDFMRRLRDESRY
ncbi:hypothetical protein H261_14305 [Paramagnetospirillum caucaseum]|uniref:Antitoxin n=1 Tax=Paramagnetospirillum caucaseum TaxID=1244869 RepID=M3A8V8_9PROT|nr:type II toxin-antitoxin system prevent-host-death family antitoxin [Paramagnetospirillum caucaseum]EME69218.1 hypothetical protein H261_14305 [Paramagnetospirillum caucaseum]